MILLTGASGFVGRYVLKELQANSEQVIVVIRNRNIYRCVANEIIVEADLDEDGLLKELAKYEIDTCVHLAWQGMPDYNYENSIKSLELGFRVLEICKGLGVTHLIMSGTCFEYDSPQGAIRTDYPINNDNFYSIAKNSLRRVAHLYCKENDIFFNWLRLFYVYGVGQRETSLIPSTIRALKNDEALYIRNYCNRNDFVYVKDVAKAIRQVIYQKPNREILNVGSGYSLSVSDVVFNVAKLLDKKIDDVDRQEDSITDFYADPDEMFQEYGWRPSYTLERALMEMLR